MRRTFKSKAFFWALSTSDCRDCCNVFTSNCNLASLNLTPVNSPSIRSSLRRHSKIFSSRASISARKTASFLSHSCSRQQTNFLNNNAEKNCGLFTCSDSADQQLIRVVLLLLVATSNLIKKSLLSYIYLINVARNRILICLVSFIDLKVIQNCHKLENGSKWTSSGCRN